MRSQNQKNNNLASQQEPSPKAQQFSSNKGSQPYRSYFFRNQKQVADPSPSQSSQTNKLSKTKSRLKSTRIKSKNGNCIYYQLESTKKKEDQALRQENVELKQTIAELKISLLYQIDEKKLRNLLMEIDSLKQQLKVIKKENQNLKIQNDFLNRANFQLKLEVSRLRKKGDPDEASHSISKEFKNLRLQNQGPRPVSPGFRTQIPEHLLLQNRKIQFSVKSSGQTLRTSMNQNEQLQSYLSARHQQDSLSRIQSEHSLNQNPIYSQSRRSQRTAAFTETQNNQYPFQ